MSFDAANHCKDGKTLEIGSQELMKRHPLGRKFLVELIKPSHYDDDGYVIQWWRGCASCAARMKPPSRRRARAFGEWTVVTIR